jgi:hypothetical protein
MLTKEFLDTQFTYDPVSGDFQWTDATSKVSNQPAKIINTEQHGYLRVYISGNPYLLQRLIYIMQGEPKQRVIFQDGIRTNLKWLNIKPSESLDPRPLFKHNRSGQINIGWYKSTQQWRVRVRQHLVGYFGSMKEAIDARDAYKLTLESNVGR